MYFEREGNDGVEKWQTRNAGKEAPNSKNGPTCRETKTEVLCTFYFNDIQRPRTMKAEVKEKNTIMIEAGIGKIKSTLSL